MQHCYILLYGKIGPFKLNMFLNIIYCITLILISNGKSETQHVTKDGLLFKFFFFCKHPQ